MAPCILLIIGEGGMSALFTMPYTCMHACACGVGQVLY